MGIFSKRKTNELSAQMYEESLSYLGKDDKKAFEILMKAAEIHNEVAEFQIATMYETGKGTKKDLDKAVMWYAESVDDGYPIASLHLARIYIKGYDPEFNEDEAVGLLTELLDSKNMNPLRTEPDITYEIAEMLCTGKSSFQNKDLGMRLMTKGADLKIKKCMEYLG